MREYAKLGPKAWHGQTFKALRKKGPKALLVGLYLLSSPSSNMLGLYAQPLLYMAHETGLGLEGAMEGLRGCIEAGYCGYDEESEFVWVYEMAKYQVAEALKPSDLRCKGLQRDYDTMPDNPFLAAFFDRYSEAFNLKRRRGDGANVQQSEQAPSKPLPSQEQEQEQEKEQEQEQKKPPPPSVVAPLSAAPRPSKPACSAGAPPSPRGERLPADWQLPLAWSEWALRKYPAWTPDKVQREADGFRDHWLGKAGKDANKVDWLATWRKWCNSDLAHRDDAALPSRLATETSAAYLARMAAERAAAREGITRPPAKVRELAKMLRTA